MADPYIGEVRIFGFNYAPYMWAFCNGATLSIQQNSALYALMGTSFGGDGRSNFMLPNLSARAVCGVGQGPGLTERMLGDAFGEAQVSLTADELAPHNHQGLPVWEGGTGVRTAAPSMMSALSGADIGVLYAEPKGNVPMSPTAISMAGGNAPHENHQPMLSANFCISLSGVFPTFP